MHFCMVKDVKNDCLIYVSQFWLGVFKGDYKECLVMPSSKAVS